MDREIEIIEFVLIAMFAVLGVVGIVGFIMTLMWHCLLFAAMSAAMVWVWYYEEFKSKNKKLSTLWQKKNTKN